jgi:4-aminobutyrate aminotransferase-like enzyme
VGIIVEEQLVERARNLGARFRRGLEVLAERFRCVANVRGEGLFLGFDLVSPDSSPWTPERCRTLFDALLKRGLLTMAYAPRVRINPPLVITEDEIDESLATLTDALHEVGG